MFTYSQKLDFLTYEAQFFKGQYAHFIDELKEFFLRRRDSVIVLTRNHLNSIHCKLIHGKCNVRGKIQNNIWNNYSE